MDKFRFEQNHAFAYIKPENIPRMTGGSPSMRDLAIGLFMVWVICTVFSFGFIMLPSLFVAFISPFTALGIASGFGLIMVMAVILGLVI